MLSVNMLFKTMFAIKTLSRNNGIYITTATCFKDHAMRAVYKLQLNQLE